MKNFKTKITFLKINLLLLIHSFVFAQTTKIESLQNELASIYSKEGDSTLNYAQKLIEIGTVYYENNIENESLIHLDKGRGLLKFISENLSDSYDERIEQRSVINKGYVKIDFIQWHFFIQKKEYEKAETLLKERAWVNLCINTQQFSKVLEVFKILVAEAGTESATFLNHWSLVYGKLMNLKDLELLWQFLIEQRISEFGENSEGHISALFGLSNCYKRLEENDKYSALKAKVEAKWENAYVYDIAEVVTGIEPKSESKTQNKVEEKTKDKKQNAPKSGAAPKPHNKTKTENRTEDKITENKEDTANVIYTLVEVMPRFPGCELFEGDDLEKKKCADKRLLNFIYKNITYPDKARENGVEGMAVISFTVTEHGTIINLEILRDPGSGCGKEVLRIMNLMNEFPSRWKSGVQKGKNVRVKYNLPVNFKLS